MPAKLDIEDIVDQIPGAAFQLLLTQRGGVWLQWVSVGIRDLVGIDKKTAERDVQALFALVLPSDLKPLQRAIQVVADEARMINHDFRIRHAKTGEVRWLRSRARPVRNADGTVVCNGIWLDITDLKQSA